ncbi:hypothetical protein [Sneathiella glossodoripedis]|uniref:hypothetical protein n=1 Tax=Sneathiella glossodoripedis TaxID=418853 RepID=UPI000472D4FB|nr:hypothetical protein [Sneathiella glossodoripedis]
MLTNLFKLFGASLLSIGLMSTTASASTILDFTSTAVRDAILAPTSGEVAFAGTTATVSATGGSLTWTGQDGSSCASPPLACQLDGIGVRDDEVSGGTQESIIISFANAVTLNAVYFLDLFTAANGDGQERAEFSWSGGTSGNGSGFALSDPTETPTGDSGYLMFLLPNINVTQIVFTAPGISPGDNLGRNDYAVAAVSVVPLPAALPLYGTALAVLGFMGWRRKRKS